MTDQDRNNSYGTGRYGGIFDGTQESYQGILDKENAEAFARSLDPKKKRARAAPGIAVGLQPIKALLLLAAIYAAAIYFGASASAIFQVTLVLGAVVLAVALVALAIRLIGTAIELAVEWFFGLFVVRAALVTGVAYVAWMVGREFL